MERIDPDYIRSQLAELRINIEQAMIQFHQKTSMIPIVDILRIDIRVGANKADGEPLFEQIVKVRAALEIME